MPIYLLEMCEIITKYQEVIIIATLQVLFQMCGNFKNKAGISDLIYIYRVRKVIAISPYTIIMLQNQV